jgi:hypothetical protein
VNLSDVIYTTKRMGGGGLITVAHKFNAWKRRCSVEFLMDVIG